MLTEKQQQAKQLYFQTDLTKTQIAGLLNVSRRSLHYWICQNNWERLKRSATHLPAMLAENCYLLISQYQRQLLSEDRIMQPINHLEAETLHKLALTVKKLKNHSTLNESMEMFAHFMERVSKRSPELAAQIAPFVEEHIQDWASLSPSQFKPDNINDIGYLSTPADHPNANEEAHQEFIKERNLDGADIHAWDTEVELHDQLEYFEKKQEAIQNDPQSTEDDKQQNERIIKNIKTRIQNLPKDDSFPPPICHPACPDDFGKERREVEQHNMSAQNSTRHSATQ